jgi:hypothetical protein
VCCHYRFLQHAIRYCSKGCDVSTWVSIIRCSFMGTYVKSKRRNISLTEGVSMKTVRFNPLPRRNVL